MEASRKSGKAPDTKLPGRPEGAAGNTSLPQSPSEKTLMDSDLLSAAQDRDFDAFMSCIRAEFGDLTQQELAELLGVTQPTVSVAKRRGKVPLSWIFRFRSLLNGKHDQDSHSSGLLGEHAPTEPSTLREHAGKTVRIYGTRCEWPGGGNVPVFPVVGHETLSRRFIADGVLIFRVESPAMQLTLGACALVGVDSRDRTPVSGALFAVCLPGEGLIVRRFSHAGEKVLLCAELASLPPVEMAEKDLESRMIGRCVWVMREL